MIRGIEIASEHKGKLTQNVIVRNNVVYNCTAVGLTLGGYSKSVGSTSGCTITNNTLYHNDTDNTGSGELQLQYFPSSGIQTNLIQNNIFYANSQGVVVSNPFASPVVTLNNNLYYSSSSNDFEIQYSKKSYASLLKFQTATAQDGNSQQLDPLFMNPASQMFALQQQSPALGKGNASLGTSVLGTSDFSGAQRVVNGTISIGAYQS
jgi:hypothetical protein